jgi:signal transduction histidine kinase
MPMISAPVARATYLFPEKIELDNPVLAEFYTAYLRGLTHKLNNLLAVFQGFSSLLLMNETLDGSAKESLGHMKAAALNGQDLSGKILAAGACARLSVQKTNLSDQLPNLARGWQEPCHKLDVPFELRADPNLPVVQIDQARFKEMLTELLKNAAEAVKEQGAGGVAMEIYAPGRSPEGSYDRVDLFVHNTGRIREDKFADIFKPFVSTKDGSHFGLGLTVAANLAYLMGMTLGARSEGDRTTFWLSIPVAG